MRTTLAIFLFACSVMISSLGFALPAHAATGGIVSGIQTSAFLDTDLDADTVKDRINWKPTKGTAVVVSDTAVTGTIFGETVGWINLNPTNGGVSNTCSGVLSGYAWGENTGWINFNPTNGGVMINTTTGNFSGHAWTENYGWIKFDPAVTNNHVQTDWHGCTSGGGSGSGSLMDLCSNIAGNQFIVPAGYIKTPAGAGVGICLPVGTTIHVCSDGIDNDGDGLTDYLSDPGCVSPTDDTEDNAVSIFICSDGIDNDGDGLTDYPVDPGCSSRFDMSELTTPVPPPDTSSTSLDDTTTGTPTVYDYCPGIIGLQTDSSVCPDATPEPISRTETMLSTLPFAGTLSGLNIPWYAASIIAALGLLASLPGLAARFGHVILTLVFYHKRKPWGIVYDARTKEPLDPAIVTVFNAITGEQIDQRTTDIEGRYGFLLKPGTYRITAGKTNYQFPSQTLAGRQSDEVYKNLYFGETFTVPDDGPDRVVTLNIPMDMVNMDWNQDEKKRLHLIKYLTHNSNLWQTISSILFVVGFVFSVGTTYFYPVFWNIVMVIMYIGISLLGLFGHGPIHASRVTVAGQPLSRGLIRVFNAHLRTEIAHRVTDENGQYYILVPNGEYYMTIDQRNTDGSATTVYTSTSFEVTGGVVSKNLTL